jgi:hypothetical protein
MDPAQIKMILYIYLYVFTYVSVGIVKLPIHSGSIGGIPRAGIPVSSAAKKLLMTSRT